MTRLDDVLLGAGGALLGLGAVFCLFGDTEWGGPLFGLGVLLTVHVGLRWRRP